MVDETPEDIRIEIALVKQTVALFGKYFEKIDLTLENLGIATTTIAKMIALHEERIAQQNKEDEENKGLLSEYKKTCESDIKELEQKLVEKIDSLEGILTKYKEVADKRLNRFEIWKATLMGAGITLSWIFTEVFHIGDKLRNILGK